jgi:transcriptional regulator with XRE-family HTH domain
MNFARRLGVNLRCVRKRAGLSQEELSFRAGLHCTAVGQLERGERVARADTLIKLAGGLAIPAGTLLEGLAWEPPKYAAGGFQLSPLPDSNSKAPEEDEG